MELITSLIGSAPMLYLGYFVTSIAIMIAYTSLYIRFTAYDEVALISAGNKSAALSLSLFVVALSIPMASAIFHSVSLFHMAIWATIALVSQMGAYVCVSKFVFKEFNDGIESDTISFAVLLGGINVAIGILNAACIS